MPAPAWLLVSKACIPFPGPLYLAKLRTRYVEEKQNIFEVNALWMWPANILYLSASGLGDENELMSVKDRCRQSCRSDHSIFEKSVGSKICVEQKSNLR